MLVLKTKTVAKAEKVEGKGEGGVTLSGSMTRQVSSGYCGHRGHLTNAIQAEVDYPLTSSAGHIPNIGRMVEDME